MSTLSEILTSMYNQATNHPGSNLRHTLRNGLTIAMRVGVDGVDPGIAPDFHLAVYRHKQTASRLEMNIILQNMPPGSLPDEAKSEPYSYGQYRGYLSVWQVPIETSVTP